MSDGLGRLSSMLMDMHDTMPIVNEIVRRKPVINDDKSNNDNDIINSNNSTKYIQQ